MAILNLGSINVDSVYRLAQLPRPGETIAAADRVTILGGKGLNQSVAIVRAGGRVRHLGAIAQADTWIADRMREDGIDTTHLHLRTQVPTGQALVLLSEDGENSIVLLAGANRTLADSEIVAAISGMAAGDWLLFQNETNGLERAAQLARTAGLKVAFAAAPFQADAVLPLLDKIDLLAVNEIEHSQLLEAAPGKGLPDTIALLITRGAKGAEYRIGTQRYEVAGRRAEVVDTTGAGDTFLGYFLASIDSGQDPQPALSRANIAASIQVTRMGASTAIPLATEVDAAIQP